MDRSVYSVEKGDRVTLVVRPECISVETIENSKGNTLNALYGEIQSSSFLGRVNRYWVEAGNTQFIVDDSNPALHGYIKGKVRIVLDKSKNTFYLKNRIREVNIHENKLYQCWLWRFNTNRG